MNNLLIEQFKKLCLEEDIQTLDEIIVELKSNPFNGEKQTTPGSLKEKAVELHYKINGKYYVLCPNFYNNMCGYIEAPGWGEIISKIDNFSSEQFIKNFIIAKERISSFNFLKTEEIVKLGINQNSHSINICNTNTNQNDIDIKTIIKNIQNNTHLNENEKKEVEEKIKEIENILKEQRDKKTKWNKLKHFLSWISDKSIEIGAIILPLIMKGAI